MIVMKVTYAYTRTSLQAARHHHHTLPPTSTSPTPHIQVTPPFKPSMNVLESTKTVRGWSDKDKAKLAVITLAPPDQVR